MNNKKTNGEVKVKTTEQLLREMERNDLDLLSRLMEAPERAGYINNSADGGRIGGLATKGLVVKVGKDEGHQKWQINNQRFSLEDRELLKDLLRI